MVGRFEIDCIDFSFGLVKKQTIGMDLNLQGRKKAVVWPVLITGGIFIYTSKTATFRVLSQVRSHNELFAKL